jgi:probable HAF family extracellular repeat protein
MRHKSQIEQGVRMMQNFARLCATLCAAVGLSAAPGAHAVDYTLTDLGLLGTGWSNSYATGINASGQVVGHAFNNGYNGTSFTDSYQAFATGANGQGMTAIPTLGGSWNKATGINDSGWVVGTSATTTSTPSGDTRGFVYEGNGNAPRSLGTLAGPSTANGISADGRIVGAYTAHGATQRAYLTDANGGAMHDIGTLGGSNSTAYGVNPEGRVVGSAEYRTYASVDTPRGRAFMTGPRGDVMMPIAVAGYEMAGADTNSVAYAINDEGAVAGRSSAFVGDAGRAFIAGSDGVGRVLNLYDMGNFEMAGAWQLTSQALGLNRIGQVVGSYYFTSNMMSHAFISGANGFGLVDVNTLSFTNLAAGVRDWIFFDATGINDSGQFITNGSNGHAYLVTPVPEPAAVLMMVCGLGWLAWRRRASING